MEVREAMSALTLTVGPDITLQRAAQLMSERSVGAAVVLDPEAHGPGIITERDVLNAVGRGASVDKELVANHQHSSPLFAAPNWDLERAAAAMASGNFRHLIVVDGGETVGMLSSKDILRCWALDGASCSISNPGY